MKVKKTAPMLVLTGAVLLISGAGPAASQTAGAGQEDRQNANAILATGAAKYLSGTGMGALERLSGRISAPPNATLNAAAVPSVPVSITEDEGISVLVNNPARDVYAISDVSSQSETAVAGFGSTVLVAFNDSFGFVYPNQSGMGYSRSLDGGATFTEIGNFPTSPSGFNEGDPGLVVNRAGVFYASALHFDSARPAGFHDTIGISKSTNGGASFGLPVYLPAAGVLPDSFQDKSFIAVDTTAGPNSGNVYVTFTSFPATDTGQLPILFSRSVNGGASFSTPLQISASGTYNQGSEPVVGTGGEIYVAWLQFSGPGGSGIVVAKSTDGGLSFGTPVFAAPVLQSGFGSGSMTGNFRINSFPRMDVGANGNIYITYGGRSRVAGDSGDVFFARSTNGGLSWSSPIRVNDDTGNQDQFFPDLAVNSDGTIRVVWYDKRADPANSRMSVFTTTSNNGGVSFQPNQPLIAASFAPGVGYDPVLNTTYMGDYLDVKAGLDANGNRTQEFLMAWTDCRRVLTTSDGIHPDQDVRFTKSAPAILSSDIILPSSLTVHLGQSVSFPITLSKPAPSGGVFLTISSSDPSVVAVSPDDVLISQFATVSTQTKVTGIRLGKAMITVSAFGLASATFQVQVVP